MIPNLGGLRFRAVPNGPALLVSAALHALLLTALILWRPDGDSLSSSVPRIVRVGIVEEVGADLESEPITETSSSDLVEPAVDVTEAKEELEPIPRTAAVEQPPTEAEPPTHVPDPAPAEETPAPPAAEPTVVAETEAETEAEPRDASARSGPAEAPATEAPTEPQLAVRTDEAPAPPAPESARAPSAEPPPSTVSITGKERRMLDRKVAEWAKDIDELAPTIAWAQDGRTYTATFTRVPAADSMGIDELLVAVTTAQDGSRWSTEMRMQRLSFSSFAQFVDRWDPEVQIHDDEIDGRFHSNTDIYVSHSGGVQPTFHGKVTTARRINTTYSDRRLVRSEVFQGGLETGAGRILLPRRFALFGDDVPDDGEHVRRFPVGARITFYADGTYGWHELESIAPEERVTLSTEPHYLMAGEDAVLHVRGVVNGKVLVHSPRGIVIEDDIVYAADPAVTADSDDYLGLVSDGDVTIGEPELTGPGDLTVHASIFARGRFVVRRYRTSERATLLVYGSVTAGSLSATEPRYATKLNFDERLADLRPPSFPLTDRYEVAAWDELWTETQ